MRPFIILFLTALSCQLHRPSTNNDTSMPPQLSAECEGVIEAINRMVEDKSEQARKARERNSPDLDELRAMYPTARDAWNRKARWIKTNGPGYSAGWGPLYGDGSSFTLEDVDSDAVRFFELLYHAAYPGSNSGRGRDIVADVGENERALMMPLVARWLDRLHNHCRDEHAAVMQALAPQLLPETFDEL